VIGQLHHVVGTYGNNTLQLFVDGVLVDSESLAGATIRQTADVITIGRGLSTAPRFHLSGGLDEVALYDRVLTAQQIRAHWEAGR
jgi:hypothetical protein